MTANQIKEALISYHEIVSVIINQCPDKEKADKLIVELREKHNVEALEARLAAMP